MSSRDQIRAEIGRRLREHYDAAASQTIPDRLAQLIDKIGESGLRGGEHSSEQARRENEECAGVRADGADSPEPWREGCLAPRGEGEND
jgi:hypothetical protein